MFINILLENFQKFIKPVYDRSFILQKIDWLIGINIFFVIVSAVFAQPDVGVCFA